MYTGFPPEFETDPLPCSYMFDFFLQVGKLMNRCDIYYYTYIIVTTTVSGLKFNPNHEPLPQSTYI